MTTDQARQLLLILNDVLVELHTLGGILVGILAVLAILAVITLIKPMLYRR
jgi:hypothetical protein